MKHDVSLEFNLTNPEELNIYNMIRNLDGIKNAISGFKDYLNKSLKDLEELKGKDSAASSKSIDVLVPKLQEVINTFDKFFRENGVTV